MRYRELFEFNPITEAIRLPAAEARDYAQQLVSSLVVSPAAGECLRQTILPNLDLANQAAHAVMVVGDHGTGKSHLIGALAGLAQHADLLASARTLKAAVAHSKPAASTLASLAGRFKVVVRVALIQETKPLHTVVLGRLEKQLAAAGLNFSFPRTGDPAELEQSLARCTAQFRQQFPETGLLVALDDLLRFLRGRKQAQLSEDLAFLAALGKACQNSPLRCLAAIDEDFFAQPRPNVPAESLRRVQAMFALAPLGPNENQFVAAERLARKTPEQKAQIKAHLERFTQVYPGLKDRLDQFADLFPIHPDYFAVVEQIGFIEEPQILQALSAAIAQLPDDTGDAPGLIGYDSYWEKIRADRTLQEVKETEAVVAFAQSLESKLSKAFPQPERQALARRLWHALAIQRLTTEDIYSTPGVTVEALRDGLCLYQPDTQKRAGAPADVLAADLTALLEELRAAVGEQNLAHHAGTGQYGLHLRKFKRFVTPELILHWINAVPFVLLLLTGALMLGSRFLHTDRQAFLPAELIHKIFAFIWLLGLPITFLLRPRVHWENLRALADWSFADLRWMVQSALGLYKKDIVPAPAGRFNTGQKINACLVVIYFFTFAATGLLMFFQGTILFPWYVHTALFFSALGSVGGHLYLALVNPSTRIALAGIFHGWSPMEYVEHHHPLSLPAAHRPHAKHHHERTLTQEIFLVRVELAVVAVAVLLAGAGLFIFGKGQLATAKQQFTKSFADCIKPNDLSTKHRIGPVAESCTKCHSYTGALPESKCTECHGIIKERRLAGLGYHGTLKGDCITCHKEHLPGLASIVPLDRKKFDHNLATFKRTGKHAALECDECHQKKRDAKMPGVYFIGLAFDKCTGCHEDPHSRQFVAACEKCHSADGWKGKDLKFAHDKDSDYKLQGKHTSVDCLKCHKPKTSGGALSTAVFKGLSHDCVGCHEDPHQKQFVAQCTTCHSPNSWKKETLAFNHDKDTKFALTAKHANVACEKCHVPKTAGAALATAKFHGLSTDCRECHKDPHHGQFEPAACTKCHSTAGWKKSSLAFDHNRDTKFALKDKHAQLDCEKCHAPLKNEPLASATFHGRKAECVDCHQDPHRGQFAQQQCVKCHSAAGWKKELLAFDHNKDAKYPLEAKHATVACEKCHVPATPKEALGTAQFRGLKTECADCHQDPHRGQFARNCTKCHATPVGFQVKLLRFAHDTDTKFKLTGKHTKVDCIKCHQPPTKDGKLAAGTFKDRGTACDVCHKVKHPDTYGPLCLSCHDIQVWPKKDPGPNHITRCLADGENLIGKHLAIECKACHQDGRIAQLGEPRRKIFECDSCHAAQNPHKGTLGTNCTKCHSQDGWKGENLLFNHDRMTAYPLDRDHINVACAKCHKENKWKGIDTKCASCHPKFYDGKK